MPAFLIDREMLEKGFNDLIVKTNSRNCLSLSNGSIRIKENAQREAQCQLYYALKANFGSGVIWMCCLVSPSRSSPAMVPLRRERYGSDVRTSQRLLTGPLEDMLEVLWHDTSREGTAGLECCSAVYNGVLVV